MWFLRTYLIDCGRKVCSYTFGCDHEKYSALIMVNVVIQWLFLAVITRTVVVKWALVMETVAINLAVFVSTEVIKY